MKTRSYLEEMEILEAPFGQREKYVKFFGFEVGDLIAYHVTHAENAEGIRQNGIKARTCQQSYERTAAVYLFADRRDMTHDVLDILGFGADCVIFEVRIPRQDVLNKLLLDGLFNGTFGLTYSAVQYLDNIPASWITRELRRKPRKEAN